MLPPLLDAVGTRRFRIRVAIHQLAPRLRHLEGGSAVNDHDRRHRGGGCEDGAIAADPPSRGGEPTAVPAASGLLRAARCIGVSG